jgi:hypothetical protein
MSSLDERKMGESLGVARANFDVNTDDGFGEVTRGIEAVGTETHAQLMFTLGAKAAVAFETSGVLGPLKLLTDMNFGMNFRRHHNNSHRGGGKRSARRKPSLTLKAQPLRGARRQVLRELTQTLRGISQMRPLPN